MEDELDLFDIKDYFNDTIDQYYDNFIAKLKRVDTKRYITSSGHINNVELISDVVEEVFNRYEVTINLNKYLLDNQCSYKSIEIKYAPYKSGIALFITYLGGTVACLTVYRLSRSQKDQIENELRVAEIEKE